MKDKLTPEQREPMILGYTIGELQEFIYYAKDMDVEKLIKKIVWLQNELTAHTEPEDELTVEQKEQRRVDDKMIRLFHMILDSQIKLYDAFQTHTDAEDEQPTNAELKQIHDDMFGQEDK